MKFRNIGRSTFDHSKVCTPPELKKLCMRETLNWTDGSSGFAFAFGWNAYYLKILGICSKYDEGVLKRNRAWIWTFLIFAAMWLPQAASLMIIWGDFNASIVCLSTNMPIAVSILKIGGLQYQRKGNKITAVENLENYSKKNWFSLWFCK